MNLVKYFFISLFLISNFAFSQNQDSIYLYQNYDKTEYMISMRDGIKLFTAVYSPKDQSQKFPIILNRTPYSASPYGKNYRLRQSPSMFEVREGYIFVVQDVRGKYMSEGDFVNMRPQIANKKSKKDVDESSDTYDTIEWLIKNIKNNNGKVGITGISYPGFYTTTGTIDAHPAVVATSPQAPIANWFLGDDFHHNGATFYPHAFNFFSVFGKPRLKPEESSPYTFNHGTVDGYKFFLNAGSLAEANKKYFFDSVQFWNEIIPHDTFDEYWKARNILPHLKNIKPAVLIVGGWFDAENLWGALNTYKAIEEKNPQTTNRIVMGPWYHGQWNRDEGNKLGDITFGSNTSTWFQENVQLPFFNYYLKGKGTLPNDEAIVFETGANQWHKLTSWPPKNIKHEKIFLLNNNRLSFNQENTNGFTEFVSDPSKPVPFINEISIGMTREYMTDDQRHASTRQDVLVFETKVIENDFTVSGPMNVSLEVSTTGTDADWIVKIIDVFPDDSVSNFKTKSPHGAYQMLVRGDVMRGKFKTGFDNPTPFEPNKITNVKFLLTDIFHKFKVGHKLMIQIQSSWFPLVDLNPQKFMNINLAKPDDYQKATHRVYHTKENQTYIELPIWKD